MGFSGGRHLLDTEGMLLKQGLIFIGCIANAEEARLCKSNIVFPGIWLDQALLSALFLANFPGFPGPKDDTRIDLGHHRLHHRVHDHHGLCLQANISCLDILD